MSSLLSEVIKDVQALNEVSSFPVTDAIILSCPKSKKVTVCALGRTPILQKSDSISLENKTSRLNLLRIPFLGQECSANEIVKAQLSLLQYRKPGTSAVVAEVVLSILSCCNPIKENNLQHYEFIVLQKLFSFWWSSIADEFPGNCQEHLKSRLRIYFGKLVSSILRTGTSAATVLLTQFKKELPDDVVGRCITANALSNSTDEMLSNPAVLESLLQSDPLRYATNFLTCFSDGKFLQSELWTQGLLDQAAKILIVHPSVQSMEPTLMSPFGLAILSRTIACFECIQHTYSQDEGHGYSVLDLANDVLLSNIVDLPMDNFTSATNEVLSVSLENREFMGSTAMRYICRLGITLWLRVQKHSHIDINSQRRLAGRLFCALSESLLTIYKRGLHGHNEKAEFDCIATLRILTSLIEEHHEFDFGVLAQEKKSLLQKVCRSALKCGIHDKLGTTEDISTLSLRFVRILMMRYPHTPILSDHFSFISPVDLLGMLTSHSKFNSMVARKRLPSVSDNDRVELIRLMHCCLELSDDQAVVDSGLWKALRVAFCAGIDELDVTIRRFFHLSSTITSETIYVPFLDQIRWAGCDDEPSREGRRWDWFIDALDTSRIRETVSRFPVDDSVDVNGTDSNEENHSIFDDEQLLVGEFNNSEDEVDNPKKAEINLTVSPKSVLATNIFVESRTQKDADLRYSPAFMLTLILGALDSCMTENSESPEDQGNRGISANPQESSGRSSPLVLMVKRLIEKGVPALCLSSLASACGKVRTLAISILAILLNECNSSEARAMSSWRERPQIALLLNAVQRAFVLEKVQHSLTMSDSPPVLPTLVSTFLARASFSISKPDDALYVPLNRFFLKTDADHGAFQDMHRLPAFISLFCSANDEPVQARKERIWALQLIRDGFRDLSSYRLVSSCHAPELILSSIENVRLSTFPEEMKSAEYVLVFETMTTFLNNGGRRAASHLIGKIGLLSWLQALCTARPIAQTFPIGATRAALGSLIYFAAVSVLTNENLLGPSVLDEICGLIRPTLELGRLSETEKEGSSRTTSTVGKTLVIFRDIFSRLENIEGILCPSIHPAGITPDEAMNFLRIAPQDIVHECTRVLCELPCRLEQGVSGQRKAAGFCTFLLDWVANKNCVDVVGISKVVLERVVVIVDHFAGSFGPEANETLANTLLSSRRVYQGSYEISRLWSVCVELLRLRLPKESVAACLAQEYSIKDGSQIS